MTVPVSNTSPLTHLAAIGQFDLLRQLYGGLLIAEAVWAKLNAGGRAWPGRDEVADAGRIARRAASNCPLVTGERRNAPLLRIDVEPSADNDLQKRSQVMVDKATTVPRETVGQAFGRLEATTLVAVNRVLAVFLGFA